MLLNEIQKLQRTNTAQTAQIRDLELARAQMQQQMAELGDLKQELHAALRQLKPKGEMLAQR
jgi:hypothetical protein